MEGRIKVICEINSVNFWSTGLLSSVEMSLAKMKFLLDVWIGGV